jgi:predicted MFS family arabinose efflux permease
VLGASLVLFPPALILYGTARGLWWAAGGLFLVGLVYLGVLSGLSTVVQLRAPAAYRGRVLSLFSVALGVAYPVGSLIQGPVVDRIGIAWTTVASAVLLSGVLGAVAVARPGLRRALLGPVPDAAPAPVRLEEASPSCPIRPTVTG